MSLTQRHFKSLTILSTLGLLLLGVVLSFVISSQLQAHAVGNSPYLAQFNTVNTVALTVPKNGDQNPYGVAVVQKSIGDLKKSDILVSNFNNKKNLQGTGTTIVEISPDGNVKLFAKLSAGDLHGACPGGVGLTTALVILQRGWVIVGSLPTKDGNAATAKAGCLIVLDSWGNPVETFVGQGINGPWDMTAFDQGDRAALFVTNVLNGTVEASPHVVNKGTVLRIDLDVPFQGCTCDLPQRVETTVIGSGFSERTDPDALVIGPTGVGLGKNNILYVADSLNNRISAIPYALTRYTTAFTGKDVSANGKLNDPLGLTIAPNGDILTVNGNDGKIVETTPGGKQVFSFLLDNTDGTGAGCLFGLAIVPGGKGVYFVDDCGNTLKIFH